MAAAKVGGIVANDSAPVDFLYDNLAIATNVMHAAAAAKVEKLLFLGSSCVYPKFAPQPIKEEALLTGPLEPTNQWYAIAKIAGLKLCQAYRRQQGCDFISAMPTNLYGPARQLRPHHQPRDPGAHPQGARSENQQRRSIGDLGLRQSPPRIPARRRRRRRASCIS